MNYDNIKTGFSSDSELIKTLLELLEEANESQPMDRGACSWVDPNLNGHCTNTSKEQCDRLEGFWHRGQRCTGNPSGFDECQAE